jgi:hypothetical protein
MAMMRPANAPEMTMATIMILVGLMPAYFAALSLSP